ncbi:LytR/AlgR family response regulator transcription factor [Dyadobacter fermentans]|uniref:Two component transcriptional regulator, LytTR family n=1 Tax=Dyadobacter fermentans (strain ATCC 700827 / DSM 18053 / CIP 107007 / KCTC 52180 / NS114) TaxID=471854 RepID=C6VTC9_DYAFD|nr:LytTR family DNA-binding domain-containing protein [Dyadobacter fermentans]ACT96493.1 two component transcriptional regulator, LytTR family [Dyadobacter fermentans DSM 18053]
MKLNCITVDDEPLALNLISAFSEQTPFLELKGRFGNAVEALQALHEQTIHLIFLDIQMPDLNGMELARVISQAGASLQTRIVFTTAYNQFAVEGYKVDALDYLLKPFGYDEFLRAATKAKRYFEVLQDNGAGDATENYMFIKSDYKHIRVDFDSVTHIESVKDYVKIHLMPPLSPVVTLSSLKSIEEKLPAARFLRIHRSFIVAVSKVDSVSKNAVQLGLVEIPVGELYKEAFKTLLARWM